MGGCASSSRSTEAGRGASVLGRPQPAMPQQEASTDNVEPSRAENPDAVALAAQETREAT